jgi:UDP-glucose 4-epimerase
MYAATSGKSLEIYGSGNQVRSFCHVFDAVKTIWDFLLNPASSTQAVNIGVYQPVRVIELARKVHHLWNGNSPLQIRTSPKRNQEVQYRAPDLSKLQTLPVHQPEKRLDVIIQDFKQYMEDPLSVDPFGLEDDQLQSEITSIRKAL